MVPVTLYDENEVEIGRDNLLFMKLHKGSYFNLSNAILKKFSLFEFVVTSE